MQQNTTHYTHDNTSKQTSRQSYAEERQWNVEWWPKELNVDVMNESLRIQIAIAT